MSGIRGPRSNLDRLLKCSLAEGSSMRVLPRHVEFHAGIAVCTAILVSTFFGPLLHSHRYSANCGTGCSSASHQHGRPEVTACSCRLHQISNAQSSPTAEDTSHDRSAGPGDDHRNPLHHDHDCGICIVLAQCAAECSVFSPPAPQLQVEFLSWLNERPTATTATAASARGPPIG